MSLVLDNITRKLYPQKMRTQIQARRIQNSTMVSPSPDNANRNIIKDTKPPMEDVKRYLNQSGKSKSPRISQISNSHKFSAADGSELQWLRKRVKQLEAINRQLQTENDRYKAGLGDNSSLQGELQRMRETLRSYQSSQIHTPRSQDKSGRNIEQMQEKLFALLNENKRLGGIINDKQKEIGGLINDNKRLTGLSQDKQNYIQTLTIENRKLKNQYETTKYQNQPSAPTSIASSSNIQLPNQGAGQDVSYIKSYYEGRIQPQMRRSETEWLNKIRQLQQKLGRIVQNQEYIQRQMVKRSTMITPIKNDGKSPLSNKQTQDPNQASSGIQLPQSVKPFQSMTMRSTTKQKQRQAKQRQQLELLLRQNEDALRELDGRCRDYDIRCREYDNKCRNLQKDNQIYRKKIAQLQGLLARARDSAQFNQTPKIGSAIQLQELYRKIRALEDQVQSKNFTMNNMERDLRSTKQDYNRLKQQTQRQIFMLENERNTCKKAYEQQRQKGAQQDDTINKQTERIYSLDSKLKEKEYGNEQLKQQLKLQFDFKEANIKKYYEDLLKNKDRVIGDELHKYLQMLSSIRRDLQDSNVDAIIGQSQMAVNERISIEKQIIYIRQENQKIIAELKTRLIQQQQHIIQLEKDNRMMQTEIQQLQSQKDKLKKAMLEFDNIKLLTVATPATTTNVSVTTTNYKNESGCKLKACLKQTIKKIDTLQHQITEILME